MTGPGRCLLAIGHLLLAGVLLATGTATAALPEKPDEVSQHLEFLGYQVSRDDEQITALHEKHANIVLKRYAGGILVSAYYVASDYGRSHRDEFIRLANQLNADAAAARYYVDKDGDLVIEGWYPGAYRKDTFGLFLENYNLMMGQLSEHYDELNRLTE